MSKKCLVKDEHRVLDLNLLLQFSLGLEVVRKSLWNTYLGKSAIRMTSYAMICYYQVIQ
jgi:hypothetical protein